MSTVTLYGHIGAGEAGGPYFDDLVVGQVFDWAPSMTLTPGPAAGHQAILGDRLRLRAGRRTGPRGDRAAPRRWPIPALVCDVAIGQSHAGHPAGQGEPVLPRADVLPLPGHRRHPVHPHRGGRIAAEQRQAGTRPHRDGGAADDHHRPGRPAGAGLLPLRDAAAEPGCRRRPAHADDLSQIGADLAAPPTATVDGTRRPSGSGSPVRISTPTGRLGAAQHRRRGQLRTGAGPADPEYCCHPS